MAKPFHPSVRFEYEKGHEKFGASLQLVEGDNTFYPDNGNEGLRPRRQRTGLMNQFAKDPFLDNDDPSFFLNEDGDSTATATGAKAPTITAERDLAVDSCATADPTKMSKKKYKQLMKMCSKKDKYLRKAARTENVRARADIKRGRAHKISGIGEEKRAKAEANKINATANADSTKAMAVALQEPAGGAMGIGAPTNNTTLIAGIPDAVTYGVGGLAFIGVVVGIGFMIKSTVAKNAAAASKPA